MVTRKKHRGGFWGTTKAKKHPGNAITQAQNLASRLRVFKIRAEEHLREHGIDPARSRMTILQQAQLLDGALKALGSLGGTDLQDFMCSENFKDKTDIKIRGYTFRGIQNKNTGKRELYVWENATPDKFMLIHSADSCDVAPEEVAARNLNERVKKILAPLNIAHAHKWKKIEEANNRKRASKRNTASNTARIEETMTRFVAEHTGENGLVDNDALFKTIANLPKTTPDELILKQGLQRLHHKMNKKSWAQALFGTRKKVGSK